MKMKNKARRILRVRMLHHANILNLVKQLFLMISKYKIMVKKVHIRGLKAQLQEPFDARKVVICDHNTKHN